MASEHIKSDTKTTLLSMGFQEDEIEKAFNQNNDNYGLDEILNIILQNQSNDTSNNVVSDQKEVNDDEEENIDPLYQKLFDLLNTTNDNKLKKKDIFPTLQTSNLNDDDIHTIYDEWCTENDDKTVTINQFVRILKCISLTQNNIEPPFNHQKYQIFEYTLISEESAHQPTVYGIKVLKNTIMTEMKHLLTEKHKFSDVHCVFICDLWKSKIHRELRRHDPAGDVRRKTDDIYVYYSEKPILTDEQKEVHENTAENKMVKNWQTYVVNNQHRVLAQQQFGGNARYEDEPLGFPLLITFFVGSEIIEIGAIYDRLWHLIIPFCRKQGIKITDDADTLPFQIWAAWGFNNHKKMSYGDEEMFDLKHRNLKFLIHWTHTNEYKFDMYCMENRFRDQSAMMPIDDNDRGGDDDINDLDLEYYNVERAKLKYPEQLLQDEEDKYE